jgi:hypothetical protein
MCGDTTQVESRSDSSDDIFGIMQLDWQTVVTVLGGQAVFLAAVAWLIKTFVSNRLAREADEMSQAHHADSFLSSAAIHALREVIKESSEAFNTKWLNETRNV